MPRHLPAVILTLLLMTSCAASGHISPLVYCDNPSDINGRVFTNCTQPIGKESP